MSANSPQSDSALLKGREQQTFSQYMRSWILRVRSGDLGQLPVILGLIVIWIVFQIANPIFLSSFNLVNLLVQASVIITIAYGVVVILLLGEIDLSMGYTAGMSAVTTAGGRNSAASTSQTTRRGGFASPAAACRRRSTWSGATKTISASLCSST